MKVSTGYHPSQMTTKVITNHDNSIFVGEYRVIQIDDCFPNRLQKARHKIQKLRLALTLVSKDNREMLLVTEMLLKKRQNPLHMMSIRQQLRCFDSAYRNKLLDTFGKANPQTTLV